MTEFSSVLADTISAEKDRRESAERALGRMREESADGFALALGREMGRGEDNIALSAVVLLRRKVLEDKDVHLLPETYGKLREMVLLLINPTKSVFFLKHLVDILANLAISSNFQSEIPSFVSQWATSTVPPMPELALYLVELASDYEDLMSEFTKHTQELMSFLLRMSTSGSFHLRTAAAKAICAFLSSVDDSEAVSYSHSLRVIVEIVVEGAKSGEETVGMVKSLLESLSELTESVPKMWSSHLELMAEGVIGVAGRREVDVEVRLASAEAAVTFLVQSPKQVAKSPSLLSAYVRMGLLLTSELENCDDFQTWATELDTENTVENTPFCVGKDVLAKIADSAGENSLGIFLEAVPQLLRSSDWREQHTGILTVGLISHGCHSAFERNLTEIIHMIFPFISSDNPRLQWSALTSLGILCGEFAPSLQLQHHATLLPALLACFQPDFLLKVQLQSVSSLLTYAKGVLDAPEGDYKTTLLPYAPAVCQLLVSLIESGLKSACLPLLEETLSLLSVLASTLKTDFQLYYDQFMPGLQRIVGLPARSEEEKTVRANSIRCIGYLVDSTAELGGRFREEARNLYAGLMQLRADMADEEKMAALEVASFFASALREEFLPFAGDLVCELIEGVSTHVAIGLVDSCESLPCDLDSITLSVRGKVSKQFCLDSSALHTKLKCCRILYDLVRAMGSLYSPFLKQSLQTLIGLFSCSYSSDIRKYAYKTAGVCSGCCRDNAQAEESAMELIPVLLKAIGDCGSEFPTDTKRLMRCLQWWTEGMQQELAGKWMDRIADTCANAARQAFCRKRERLPAISSLLRKSIEGDELSDLQSLDSTDDELIRTVMETVGFLLKSQKSAFQLLFQQHFQPIYAEIFQKSEPSDVELLSAVCLFDDYVEFVGDLMESNGRSAVFDEILRCCSHSNPDIRQSAIYGIGVCAQAASASAWANYRTASLQHLTEYIASPESRSEALTVATDCAISSLGKVALRFEPELIPLWLSHLPIKAEPVEAQAVHRLFLGSLDRMRQWEGEVGRVVREIERLHRESPQLAILHPSDFPLLLSRLPS